MSANPALRQVLLRSLAAIAVLGLGGCNSTFFPTAATGRPKVVVTAAVLCDMTRQVAANTVDLNCLIPPASDPHIYEPTPSDRKSIEQAKLILYAGYDFEPSLIKLIRSTDNPAPKVAVDELAVPHPQTFQENGRGEFQTDPHVWNNAENGVLMVKVVQQSLTQLEPKNTALYAKNALALTTELSQINVWIKSQIATIPADARRLVTTHDAFGYYSKAYGIPVEGALVGISTLEKPTGARIKALVDKIELDKVPTIFVEQTASSKLINAIAKEAKAQVSQQPLYADGIGAKGSSGDTYPKMLIANTQAIVAGLGGKVTPFKLK